MLICLRHLKKKTLILDADCGLANIDLILGLTPKYNLYHVLKGERTLKEAIVNGPGGIKIIAVFIGNPGDVEFVHGTEIYPPG